MRKWPKVESDHRETQRGLGRAEEAQICAIARWRQLHIRATLFVCSIVAYHDASAFA